MNSLQIGGKYIQQLYSDVVEFNVFARIALLFGLLFHLLTVQLLSNFFCNQRNDAEDSYS